VIQWHSFELNKHAGNCVCICPCVHACVHSCVRSNIQASTRSSAAFCKCPVFCYCQFCTVSSSCTHNSLGRHTTMEVVKHIPFFMHTHLTRFITQYTISSRSSLHGLQHTWHTKHLYAHSLTHTYTYTYTHTHICTHINIHTHTRTCITHLIMSLSLNRAVRCCTTGCNAHTYSHTQNTHVYEKHTWACTSASTERWAAAPQTAMQHILTNKIHKHTRVHI